MRYELEATTSSARLLLFDPAAIPVPSRRGAIDREEEIERLERIGVVCPLIPDSTGAALLHLYVDEAPPERLLIHAEQSRVLPSFPVPSGRLRIAGMEDFQRGDGPESRPDGPGAEAASLAPGAHRLSLYRIVVPERSLHEAFRAQAPLPEYMAWSSMKVLIPLAVAAWIGLVAVFFTTVRVPYPDLAAPLFGLLFALPFVVRRLEAFAAARARYARLVREHPSWLAILDAEG